MINLKSIKVRALDDPEASIAYEMQKPEFAIARELIAARVCTEMTKEDTNSYR